MVIIIGGVIFLKREPIQRFNGSTIQPASQADQEQALRREQVEAVEKLVAAFPASDDAVHLAGLVYNDQGDSERAMNSWRRSLELDATRADANESLGYALLLRDEYEQAEKYLRRAIEIDPQLTSARLRLATALSHQGNMEEVLSVLGVQRSKFKIEGSDFEVPTDLPADGYRLLGDAYRGLKQYQKARSSYETAVKIQADLAEAHYGLSQVLAQLGEADKSAEALAKFNELRQKSDREGRAWRKDFAPLEVTRKSVAQTHTDVGRVYMMEGRATEAEQLWLRAAALDRSNGLCRLQLAVYYQRTHRPSEALQVYEELVKLEPGDGLVHLNIGRVCLKLKQFERAEAAFKEVIRLVPSQPEGHSSLAELYLQTSRNVPEAIRLAERAARLASGDEAGPYYAILGQAYAMNGDHAGALTAFNRAIELQPGNEHYQRLREKLQAMK